MRKDVIVALGLIVLAVTSRLITHQWNFTAVGAVSLISGLIISRRLLAASVPLVSLIVSDYFIGFHSTMGSVYVAYIAMVFMTILMKPETMKTFVMTALLGSFAFFIISNLGVYFEGLLYPMTFSGLVDCFTMALPFYKWDLLSTVSVGAILYKIASLNRDFLTIKA